ncbi:hypothetical protein BBBOND_0212360 [Babesia bigemina]|uniref:C3H1-type domain-containing protein n=1 Tax=Babesia bigemina TaxID=5866 RepID=A0A061DAZ7_BABBI|nr:hypothetical protein BBBOND_0212360 [Babesia bigemina]CDR96094.1 hypothetical protein BBBOND_0212360 [Babesia bigemina]|eukprot:XP_012768280.1 hypothetical protein BBBOND_0212360 [Babesia bigemina]
MLLRSLKNLLNTKCLEDCKKQHGKYPENPALKDIESKLQQVKKLGESLKGLTDNNNCEKLLDNLCTGLETFLGFNKDSKGYDGSGIVYSDLDRLCDGVMGFLSGVLGAVKNENEVITYDTDKNKDINTVINTLNNKIGSGRTGLLDAVGAVKGWLEGYRRQIWTLTGSVNIEIEKLKDDIINKESMNTVSINDNKPLKKQLEEWTTVVEKIKNAARKIETNHVNKLDYTLSNKINGELNVVKEAVKMLKESAEQKEFKAQAAYVDEQLGRQKREVVNKIKYECEVLQVRLNDEIKKILLQLGHLGDEKRKHFEKIREAISQTRDAITENVTYYDSNYTDKIWKHLYEIKMQLENYVKDDKSPLQTLCKAVQSEAKDLDKRIQDDLYKFKVSINGEIFDHVKKYLKTVRAAIPELENVYKRKLVAVRDAVIGAVGNDGNLGAQKSGVLGKLKDLDDDVKKDLRKLRDRIKNKLDAYVKGQMAQQIKEAIQEETKAVAHHEEAKKTQHPGHLDKITDGIRKYAQGLRTDSIVATVEQWLIKILDKNDTVNMHIDWYIQSKQPSISLVGDELESKRSQAIAFIKPKISNLLKDREIRTPSINGNVTAILSEIIRFHDDVVKAIEQGVDPVKADSIATEVETTLGFGGVSSGTSDPKEYLKSAIRTISLQLILVVRKCAEEIKSFAGMDKQRANHYELGKNVNDAIETIKALGQKISDALGKTTEVDQLGGQILGQIAAQLKDVIDGDGIDDLNLITFNENSGADNALMPNYLKQTKRDISGVGTGDGVLRAEIKNINKKVAGIEGEQSAPGNIKIHDLESYDYKNKKRELNAALKNEKELYEELQKQVGNAFQNAHKDLSKIKDVMKKCHDTRVSLESSLIQIQAELFSLANFVTTLDDKKNQIVGIMDGLKQDINALQNKINYITQMVKESNDAIDSAILDVEKSVRETYKALNAAFTVTQRNLIATTEQAFNEITKEVQLLFNRHQLSDLTALKSLVGSQLDVIRDIITENLTTGSKGFLAKLHETFVVTVERIDGFGTPSKSALSSGAETLNTAFTAFFSKLSKQKDFTFDFDKISSTNDALDNLLKGLVISQHFDHGFTKNLQRLKNRLGQFTPEKFGDGESPAVLEALRKGYPALVGELDKAYVNTYDGADSIVWSQKTNNKDHPSEDSAKCAKVCLSLLSILYSEFKTILKYCVARCKSDQININTELGKYFATQGYKVTEDGKKHWELQDSKGMTGLFICKRMFGSDEHHLYYIDKSKQNALDTLHDCLQIYYQVCHVATFSARKRPCNIFEMLCWVSGLPCNNVYQHLLDDAISELFVDPTKQPEDADGIPVTYISDEPLAAYPQNIALDNTQRAVKRLCSRSHDILTTIAGTGDAYSMYAVDYSTNSLNFHYPSKGEDCLQMLLDVLRRLLPSLKFLHTQCGLSATYHGWSGCQYGRGVKHSNWQCGEHPADESTDCQPRSPLMSYLRDSLPGCLPHQLVSAGCKSECKTCPKSLPGAPCITPLGFRGFSGSTKTGKDICTVLTKFFDISNINALFGLLPKPPSTLPEHFQFALTLSSMLDNAKAASDVSLAFETKTKALSIELYKETSKLTGALQNAYRNQTGHNSSGHSKSTEADLWSLSKDSCNLPHDRDIHCAAYLCSTSSDAYTYLAKKHADLYLSWAVYLR